jgi:hypothetical protein
MKTFTLILLLSVFAVAFTAPLLSSSDSKAVSVQEFSARRLKLPAKVKQILKKVVLTIVGGLIDCIFGFFADKLNKIPFFKNLPFAKMAVKAKDKLKTMVLKKVGELIDKLRRIRRLHAKRQLFFKKLKKAAKKAGKAAKSVSKKAAKVAKKGVKAATKIAKNAGQLAKALDKLSGGQLSKAMIKLGCPIVTRVVQHGMDVALKSFGFPGVPPCIPKAVMAGCVKGVKSAFKRQLLLRRLSIAF